ncbi:MAG: hypothetical protein K8T10_08975 [Candidatus Eremiobacteraeota bacterium]|nr:hypothetical protein [Candidatus Eremiobacteraeota bacterium]
MKISWNYPKPRKGLAGAFDRFVGPGATKMEIFLQILFVTIAAIALPVYAVVNKLGWNMAQLVIGSIIALDMTGGVITNATSSAKRYWHREGVGFGFHIKFILIHAVQLFVVAYFFRSMDWSFFAISYIYLIIGALIILKSPLYLQRPVAMMMYLGGLVVNFYVLSPSPRGMEWFLPVFFLKLFICHLLREEPYRPDDEEIGKTEEG